jgi:hypothetical protein
VIQLVHLSIGFYVASLFGYLVHYSVYAANGVGVPGLLVCGESMSATQSHCLTRSHLYMLNVCLVDDGTTVMELFSILVFILGLLIVARGINVDECDWFDPNVCNALS